MSPQRTHYPRRNFHRKKAQYFNASRIWNQILGPSTRWPKLQTQPKILRIHFCWLIRSWQSLEILELPLIPDSDIPEHDF